MFSSSANLPGFYVNLDLASSVQRQANQQASNLLRRQISLKVVKQVCFKGQLLLSFHQGDFFLIIFSWNCDENYGKLSTCRCNGHVFRLPAIPFWKFACHLLTPPKVNTPDVSQGRGAESLGHSSNKARSEMRSVHIHSLLLQHDKSSEGTLDLHLSIDTIAPRIIQAALN